MINMKTNTRRKLSGEILGLLAVTLVLALILLQFLGIVARAMIDSFLFMRDIVLTEAQYAQLDDWVFHLSLLVSVAFFIILFLFLLGERLSYIREVLAGIDALRSGQEDYVVPLEGSNELTQLAEAVNYLSRTQREVKEQERVLNEEKEQFIRALSHDIRTPLTSIMAYSELLTGANTVDPQEQTRYLELIQHKAGQIKDMTDILLDGSKRNPEYFEDARLLIEQLTAEFEEMLEDDFSVERIVRHFPEPSMCRNCAVSSIIWFPMCRSTLTRTGLSRFPSLWRVCSFSFGRKTPLENGLLRQMGIRSVCGASSASRRITQAR